MTTLTEIRESSWLLRIRAERIVKSVEDVLNVPDYPTKAEDELDRAEAEIRRALAAVQYARKAFRQKPVEPRRDAA